MLLNTNGEGGISDRTYSDFSCLKCKDERDAYTTLWLETKNGFSTVTSSAENHEVIPRTLPGRWWNQMFMTPRSCSVLARTSSAQCNMSY